MSKHALKLSLFQNGIFETACPPDERYILPGIIRHPEPRTMKLGLASLLAAHALKSPDRDNLYVIPESKKARLQPSCPPLEHMPVEPVYTKPKPSPPPYSRAKGFSISSNATSGYGSDEGEDFSDEQDETDAFCEDYKPEACVRPVETDLVVLQRGVVASQTATPPARKKKKWTAKRVFHIFGWVFLCPFYAMCALARESPDEEDLHEDDFYPCFSPQ